MEEIVEGQDCDINYINQLQNYIQNETKVANITQVMVYTQVFRRDGNYEFRIHLRNQICGLGPGAIAFGVGLSKKAAKMEAAKCALQQLEGSKSYQIWEKQVCPMGIDNCNPNSSVEQHLHKIWEKINK